MQLSLDTVTGIYQIRAYEEGRIQINNNWINHSVIISPDQLIDPWRPASIADLKNTDFESVLALTPEVVLLGTGSKLNFPAPEILASIYAQQIGVEIMDTGAACRTYNLLMAEGRRVVAALLITPPK